MNDFKQIFRIAEQATSKLVLKSHPHWDDLVNAAALALVEVDDSKPSKFKYVVARRRAIDEWRKISHNRLVNEITFSPMDIDIWGNSPENNSFKVIKDCFLEWDEYPSDNPPPLTADEVARKYATDEREYIIFETIANGGTKAEAANRIDVHPSRVSQLLASYRKQQSKGHK